MTLEYENEQLFQLEHFQNPDLEQEYLQINLSENVKSYKPFLPVIGIVNFLFIIPDYLNNSIEIVKIIFALRLLVLFFSIMLYYKTDKFSSIKKLYMANSLYEISFFTCFLIVGYLYDYFIFTIQVSGLIILIIGVFFIIPNKLSNKFIISLLSGIIFYAISFTQQENHLLSLVLSSAVMSLLIIILCGYAIYNIERFKRIIFLRQKKYEELSITDPLTGIYNKRKFIDELNRHIEYVKRYKNKLSLIIFDIDFFKSINDKHGHIIGDKALIEIAQLIDNSIREIDIFARIGGEEFAIILPNTEQKDAQQTADRLRKIISVNSFCDIDGLTCSFGVGEYQGGSSMDFIDTVDQALFKAKHAGRNQVAATKYND